MITLLLKLITKILNRILLIISDILTDEFQCLNIEYVKINSLNAENNVDNSCRGTHLNESGNTKDVEDYIKNFSIDEEIKIASVNDNLFFLDNFIAPYLPESAVVLDIGCGLGKYGKLLKRKGAITHNYCYTGVDRNEQILKYARLYFPEFEFISSDNSIKIPCEDNSKDLVMASSMLQYTLDKWIESLKEMFRISKNYIYISRLPIVRQFSSCYVHQTVRFDKKSENHYFEIFNRQEFEDTISMLNHSILYRDYGKEIIYVKGINEPIILNQYLIGKTKN